MRRLAGKVFLALLVGSAGVGMYAHAAPADTSLEYRVKAAFLYNFAKFVTWPPDTFSATGDVVVFCIVGDDPFEDQLDNTLNERRIEGRTITVRRLPFSAELAGCHLIFSGVPDGARMARVLQQADASRSLTVGESDEFLVHGGMIRLLVDDGKVRFDINVKAAENVGLKLSSQLLKLARHVER
jgi:hypothetical protein